MEIPNQSTKKYFLFKDEKNPLVDRIYDRGIGGKFNEFSAQQAKGKEIIAFITNFEDLEGLHNDPNYVTNKKLGTEFTKGSTNAMTKNQKTTNKKKKLSHDPQFNADKINLLNKKFDPKNKEPVMDSFEKETIEKTDKNLQELESITGFKTMNKLPPSRGTRYNSVNPMERLRIVKRNEDITDKTDKISQPLEPKLTRPTTTIVSLTKQDTRYIDIATRSKINFPFEMEKTHTLYTEEKQTEEERVLTTINNMMDDKTAKPMGDDEDQYMDKINKFIKEAFEGKDYRINFVYYLPSNHENFYELQQTSFDKINKERIYYTLSAKGLTVYIDKKPKEFIKLSEWIIERQGYNYVSGISFFKNFKIWRILKIWRKNIFKQKKIAYQNELANNLLFNNKDYNGRLCLHKERCNLITREKILDLRVGLESINFEDFIKKQSEVRKRLQSTLKDIHKKCEEIFVYGIKSIFNEVQRKINAQNNEANYNDDASGGFKKKKMGAAKNNEVKEERNDNNEENMLSDDNIVGFENIPYKFKMMIKNECMNFIKLAFLFDYIMLDVLRRTYMFSMKDTLKRLEDFNLIEPAVAIKENILNKRDEYVKPINANPNRLIPYFLVKCTLKEKFQIENRDKVNKKVRPFYVKATGDDEFDPTAHLQIDPEEEELMALANSGQERTKKEEAKDDTEKRVDKREMDIEVEMIERSNNYFISYDPDPETLMHTFIKQVDEGVSELKVPGWRAHREFSKYLHYLENWDDRYSDWSSGEKVDDLNPQEILSLSEDPLFLDKNDLVEAALKVAYKKCDNQLQKLNPYLQLHWKQMKINKNLLLMESLKDSDEMFRLLFYYLEKNIKTLQRWIPFEEEIGMIKLTLEEHLRKDLVTHQSETINFLKPSLPIKLRERAHRIERWISEMYRSIHGNIDSEKQYLEKTKAKDTLDQWFYFYERKLNTIDTIANLLKSKGFEVNVEDTKSIDNINSLKFSLKIAWDELNDNLTKNKEKLKHIMMTSSIPSLLKETDRINSLILDEKFISYESMTGKSLIPSFIVELETYENMFKTIEKNKNTYNDFLKILGEADYNFDQVESVHDNLRILKNLWNALKDFDEECDEWKKTKFSEIDTDKILKRIDEYYTHGKKAEMQFGDQGSAMKELLTNVNNFKESMQVINDLNSSYLKPPHWDRIQKLFDIPERLDNKDYPLEFLLKIKAYEHQKIINEISLEAKNLEILKMKMAEIIKLKNGIMFTIVVENDTYKTFQKLEEVVEKIEECQSKLNNVLASKYVRLLQLGKGDDPYTIKSDLDGSLEMIEDVKTFQSKWRYLNNILNAPGSSGSDIRKKIPDNNFDKIDNEWKNIMNKLNDPPSVITFYNSRIKKVQENFFQKNLYQLEQIQIKIEQYLTSMRGMFERFYFISNDDLLYMLSNSSPEKINELKPYLSKIFEDIADLLIPPKNDNNSNGVAKEIAAVISASKEEMYFEKNFERKTVKLSEKLEEWLRNLEVMIVNTLKEKMNNGFASYADITKDPFGHESWLEKISISKDAGNTMKENLNSTENISQVVATVTHVMFCDNTEAAILMQRVESTSLTQWYKKIEMAIKTYARMVNKDFTSGNKNMRRIISNLITHHVHYLEILRNLCVDEPSQIEDFTWQQQLRSYILPSEVEKTPVVRIKQLKSDMEYGYEYIGPSLRVVITPLTDRVWLTMTSAIHIKLGCSLGGPAGTGKTETTKDLAKFFGIQCIVFNCSEQIDYKILGNIFSGLCAHKQGAYACLDEFNRINVEVLSVVATQLFTIRQGLLSMAPGEQLKQIPILPPTLVELVGKLGVFVTMNPTYSGRTELPDNLKSAFRPITMMVPDFLTIAEVKLYSEGFSESKVLAKKLTKLYSLASQQLSQQDHYDFTLRTVGTVLSIAGNLKRQFRSTSGKEKKEEELILLSALRDANFPKFVAQDIQLFKALLSDLFPQTELTEPTLEVFENEVKSIITKEKLYESNFTVKKSLQVFDILNIRLGICLTGTAGTGKSTCLNLVQKAMTNLRLNNNPDPRYREVVKTCLNPKSISMGELYGQENEDTKTFIFGLATIKIKEALALESDTAASKYGWVVLDGPIDTKWIENMNSVLDDSMTLCLSNGERIKLKPHVKVFFEVEDLSQASLATVSRLGIVYFGSNELGWRPYFYSWIQKFFAGESVFTSEMKNFLIQLFEGKMDETIENIEDLYKDGCIFIKPVEVQCAMSLCNFLEVFFIKENGFVGKEIPHLDNQDAMSRMKKKIVCIFAFCLLWGVFGCVNNRGFHKIESFVRNKFMEIKMENSQLIMEHYYDFSKNDFVKYSTDAIPFVYVKDSPFFSIFVPTIDTLRYSTIFELLIRNQKNVFVTGETGVGKTANLLNVLNNLTSTEEYSYIQINFSAQTSSEDTQKSLESKLEPKTGKKILGAKGGKKLTIFIDDINMPESNEWGAHPPIELLRQYLDQGGFYDRPKFFWKRIEDACMFACGGPPIGGRSKLTDRFGRHFNIISVPQAGKNVLISIYENILKGFLYANVFNELVRNTFVETTLASIELFEFICEQMKPIPAKFHYTFNIRDVSKVFQGILMTESKYISTKETFIKLWAHESLRVFGDRLINDTDLKLLQMQIVSIVKSKFKMQNWTYDYLFKENTLYFGEIHKGDIQERPYEEISKVPDLIKRLEYFQEMFNKNNKKNSLRLVFFEYAIMHILRITRVLRQPRGNMVLIGHGGNGKQTLTKFAAFTMYCQVTSITQKQYRADFREILKQAGSMRKKTILLLTDNTVTSNNILEDVNNLLNIGEIPNLYPTSDELQSVLNNMTDYMKSQGIAETREKSYETFVDMTRENLHIIFCTSPVGETLRLRFRKFPALINCCTLNWFINWPKEALISSCKRMFQERFPYPDNIKDCLVNISTTAHSDIEELTERYYSELSRRVYVTPKFFLDMVDLLLNLVSSKKGETDKIITKFTDGVKKLEKTHSNIQNLEKELTELEPKIAVNKVENEAAFERVKTEQAKLDEKTVELNDKSIQVANVKSNLMKVGVKMENEKNEILKKLSDTWNQVEENLTKEKLSQLVSAKITSEKRKVIIEAAVVLLKGKKVHTEELGRALASERERILLMTEEIDHDKISKTTFDLFANYYSNIIPKVFECNSSDEKEIDQTVEGNLSEPYKTLYKWGRGCLYCYEQIKKNLKPLKEQMLVIEKERLDKEQEHKALNDDFKKNLETIQKLKAEQSEIKQTLDDLSKNKETTTRRKNNAGQLIGLLKDEGERWKEDLIKLKNDMDNFLGNMFLSAVSISYLCPFTGVYRKEQIEKWIYMCRSNNITVSNDFSLENTLSDPVSIRSWNISGLPSDSVSVQNGIMLFNNPKYPLLIDPQLQGNQWLKKLYRNKLSIIKGEIDQSNKKQIEGLTVDIIKGNTVLVENIGEELDSLYNPVISKMIFEEGSSYIEFNNNKIEFNPNFQIYFTTKLSNPHYSPEYYIKLNIINFTVTFQGLTEQLLSEVFKGERRDKYELRDGIIESMGKFNQDLVKLSKEILQKLSDANEELILDDEGLILTLQNAKSVSDVVKDQMTDNDLIEKEINMIRDAYVPVATRGSILYFVIVDLGSIDPMYQFSLEYFKKIFAQSIKRARQTHNVSERVRILERAITEDIYRNIKRGIFESHKTIFSFLIAIYIKRTERVIEDDEWNLFLKGPISFDKTDMPENPDKNYFSDFQWDTLLFTENRYKIFNLSQIVTSKLDEFKKFFEELESFNDFNRDFPGGIDSYINSELLSTNNFLKLMLLKIFRPDKVLVFIKKYIKEELGEFFIDTSPPRLEEVYEESDEKTPIIFILSQGADPTNAFLEFKNRFTVETEEGPKNPRYINISLGQGQEIEARKAILEEGFRNGTWVLLQNCHLFVTWMSDLANIVQQLQQDESEEEIHPNFRLWLTSMPNVNFPVSILQNSLKLTTEPPSGVKANIKKIYDEVTDQKLNFSQKHPDKFPKIMFTLSLFHSVLQERKKFGAIGFNLRYDFNQADFDTSIQLLQIYMEEADDVPWSSIIYLVGEVNYGGRVTDDFDRITMMATLNKFLSDRILEREKDENGDEIENGKFLDPKFSKSGKYYSPYFTNVKEYKNYIDTLPIFDEPDLFGLHENANIIYQLQESQKIQNLLLSVIPKTTQTGKSSNEIVLEIVNNLLVNKPEVINKREQRHKSHDKVYDNNLPHSLTIVLYQEIIKFNRLINKILLSLADLKKAIEGTISMSSECDEIYNSLLLNKIPNSWAKVGYPSHKPLASWFNDLLLRIEFMRSWLMFGHPHCFWISGLFFPQGFITGVLQNHARETKVPVSDINFKHTVLDKFSEDIVKNPPIGVYIHGLYLEAASWDLSTGLLVDQKPGERNFAMPIVWLETVKEEKKTAEDEDDDEDNENKVYIYQCPIFKTLKRTGIISASGRSDNYVISIDLPSKESKDFWIMRGSALICQLDD